MDKAEKWALEHFPVEMGVELDYDDRPVEVDCNRFIRPLAEKIYHQVEKDLALTWKDIKVICDCFMDVGLKSDLPARSKELYEEVLCEVLRRFNETRK